MSEKKKDILLREIRNLGRFCSFKIILKFIYDELFGNRVQRRNHIAS